MKLQAILALISNGKTHLLSGAIALLTLLQASGLIHLDPAKFQALILLLGAGTASALHQAVKKS